MTGAAVGEGVGDAVARGVGEGVARGVAEGLASGENEGRAVRLGSDVVQAASPAADAAAPHWSSRRRVIGDA